MKRHLIVTLTIGLFGSAPALVPSSAFANNRGVESALASYSDTSVFYQALMNTGVLSELHEGVHYTIFAPTNEAIAQISPDIYPCFYSGRCRPEVADVLRNHITVGRQSLKELAHEAEIPTIGRNWVYAETPYVGQYTVGNRDVLSGAELNGNMVYRVDGVIVSNAQLAQFQAFPDSPARVHTVVTYRPSASVLVPGGDFYEAPETITKTTVHRYVTPQGYPAGGDETTIIQSVNPDGY